MPRSAAFYRDVVGLPLAVELPERGAGFHWIGQPGQAMLGLWSIGAAPIAMRLHVAFDMALGDVLAAPGRLGARQRYGAHAAACCTSAPILASSAAVNSLSANATGHMLPSSRFALSLKPSVAYLVLNFSALWKKQTTLPSLAYAGIPYQVLGDRFGALAPTIAWTRSAIARSRSCIAAILASTSLSPSAPLPRLADFSSRLRSLIAARSSSVNPAESFRWVRFLAGLVSLIVTPEVVGQPRTSGRSTAYSLWSQILVLQTTFRRHSQPMAPKAPSDAPAAEFAGQLVFRLWRASHTRTAAAFETIGLTPALFALLNVIAAREGAIQQELGATLGIDPSTMVALIDRLETAGLAKRRPSPKDRRAREVAITAKGRRRLERARAMAVEVEDEVLGGLTAEERDQLLTLLRRALASAPPQPLWSEAEGD